MIHMFENHVHERDHVPQRITIVRALINYRE